VIPFARLNFLFFIEEPVLAESHYPLKLVPTFSAPFLDLFDLLTDSGDLPKTCFFDIAPKRQYSEDKSQLGGTVHANLDKKYDFFQSERSLNRS
jgi:hypothetical protein